LAVAENAGASVLGYEPDATAEAMDVFPVVLGVNGAAVPPAT
jgi:hypothetical protein